MIFGAADGSIPLYIYNYIYTYTSWIPVYKLIRQAYPQLIKPFVNVHSSMWKRNYKSRSFSKPPWLTWPQLPEVRFLNNAADVCWNDCPGDSLPFLRGAGWEITGTLEMDFLEVKTGDTKCFTKGDFKEMVPFRMPVKYLSIGKNPKFGYEMACWFWWSIYRHLVILEASQLPFSKLSNIHSCSKKRGPSIWWNIRRITPLMKYGNVES